jgi:hypothetical protein
MWLQFSETGSVIRCGTGDIYLPFWVLIPAIVIRSMGLRTVADSLTHTRSETDPVSETFFSYSEFRTMDKIPNSVTLCA